MKVRVVPERDLMRHGVGVTEDPLVSPLALLHQRDEFVVFDVELALPQRARVAFTGSVRDENDNVVAELQSLEKIREYWGARMGQDMEYLKDRLSVLDRWYAPSLDFSAPRGRLEYYLLCIGKYPIPRPAEVELFVTLDKGTAQGFRFMLEKSK